VLRHLFEGSSSFFEQLFKHEFVTCQHFRYFSSIFLYLSCVSVSATLTIGSKVH